MSHLRTWTLVLALAAAGLAAAGPADEDPPPRRALAELLEDAQSPRPAKRRVAVRRLSELGTREAWRAVIDALDDREPEVADEAQLALAALDDARVQGDLLGRAGLRARDPLVRLRVAEALGRGALPVDGERLLAAVTSREPELARTIVWSVERLALAGRLAGDEADVIQRLERLARSGRSGALRAGALCALYAVQGEAARPRIEEALKDASPEVRCAALEAARGFPREPAERWTARLAGDESPSVRAACIDALRRLATPAAARALVERLEREPRVQLASRAREALRELSGLQYGTDPRPWRRWIDAVGDATVLPPAPERAAQEAATTTFRGLPVRSDRLVFLIDFSGSLWNERADGTSRKDAADALLGQALDALHEDARFNVIPYTSEPLPWAEELRPASKRELRDARRSFERLRARGKGNFYDAARLALADPEVDTLVVLTDGVPTGGHRWNLGLMVELLMHETRFRPVAFDSVIVDAPPRVVRHWEELARRSGGQCVVKEPRKP